jgi:hypothetical protein
MNNIDFKLFFSSLASLLLIIGYLPYFRDIFKKKTRPHLFTWLIWTITQGTSAGLLMWGGGKWSSLGLVIGSFLVFSIFLLSFKYGTRDISLSDKIFLFLSLSALIVWWLLDSPLISVIMVSAIDGLAYFPTFRKTFKDPRSETIFFWIIMALVDILLLLANAQYNVLTLTYLSTLAIANIAVVLICVIRKNKLKSINNLQS